MMLASRAKRATVLDCGVAIRPQMGESVCGDRHVVCSFPDGVLLAVVDGLGHGQEAATAARVAVEALEEHPSDTLPALVERCHEALAGTRGVVMSLARVDQSSTLTWLGIGNVESVLVRRTTGGHREEHLLLRGGIVGAQLPALRPANVALMRGDVLGIATDGVRSGFGRCLTAGKPPHQLAETVLAEYGLTSDDALVVVARFKGVVP